MSPSNPSWQHAMAIAKSALVVFLLLIAVEIGLRSVEPALVRMYADSYYAVQRSLPEGRNHAENRINVAESLIRKPGNGSPRVVFVGDSVLLAVASVSVDQTLPGIVEKYLHEDGWPEARTYNTALAGLNPVDECRILSILGKKLPAPTAFIVVFNPTLARWYPEKLVGGPEEWLAGTEGRITTRNLYQAFHNLGATWDSEGVNVRVRMALQEHLALFRQLPTLRHRFQRIRARRSLSLGLHMNDLNILANGTVDDQGHLSYNDVKDKHYRKVVFEKSGGAAQKLVEYTLPLFLYTRDILEQEGHSLLFMNCPFLTEVLVHNIEERRTYKKNMAEITAVLKGAGITVIEAPEVEGRKNYIDPIHHSNLGQIEWANHVAPDIADWLKAQGFPRNKP